MTRRFWPAALAAVSILVLGSYLVYTQYLVRQIKAEAAIHANIIKLVQQGMLDVTSTTVVTDSTGQIVQSTEGSDATAALLDIQKQVQELDITFVAFNRAGEPVAHNKLPFAADLSTAEGKREVHVYAARMKARRPGNVQTVPGYGEIIFGDPPVLKWLRWVPWLQVGAGILLIAIAFIIMRADMRAHREQLWSAMARELAHQMGTPLSSLAGWVEVLQLTAEERDAMASTERIGHVMQADVERLERVSRRFELIGKPPAVEPVDVPGVVNELVSYFQPRLPHLGKGITIRARVDPDLPHIQANAVLLVWALENILKNAIDALAGRGGHIIVLARNGPAAHGAKDGTVHLIIADNGPGIAAHVRDRLFDAGVSTKSAGWGVGLSLSRRIVQELYKGRITVENRPRGGAVFDVMLPARKT